MNEMIFDTMSHRSSAPEGSCRHQNAAEAKKVERLRRKRMELRRMKTIAKEKAYNEQSSSSSDSDACSKNKKRSQTEQTELKSIGSKLARNDVGSSARTLTCESHGHISVIGRRREMEDAVAVELGFMRRKEGKCYDFFGVYDGHGGWRVANACSEMLHKFVVESLGDDVESEVIDWESVMVEGFRKMDEEVNKNGGVSVAMTGSTAVVAVVGEDEVVLANCGDSRAVLSRGGAAVQLLDDHKPDRPDELKRIEVSGGKVINWNGQRVLGVLATSRSIGDYYLKPYVINEPEVKVINRTDADEFLILASDGLWDVISNDLACKVARRCLDGHVRRNTKFPIVEDEAETESHASEAAAVLAELAMGRGSRDNISVVVVELRGAAAGQIGSCSAS